MRINLLLPVVTLFITGSGWASEVFDTEPDWTYKVGGATTNLRIEPLLLNDDAFPDLVVGNKSKDNLTVFYGVGDGSFTLGEEYPLTNISWIESADVDNDGDIDVLARHVAYEDSIALYINDGMGLLDNPIKFLGPGGTSDIPMFPIVDINNDTYLDLVMIAPVEDVYAMLGDGQGGFDAVLLFSDDDVPYLGFDCGDVDSDGDVDIVIICWQKLSVLLNDGDGSFTWNGYYGFFNNEGCSGSLDIGPLNEDSFQDIACVPGGTIGDAAVISFLGDGQGAFSQFSPGWFDGFSWNQTDISDYDLDGLNDAFFTGCDGNFLMLGDGTGNLSADYYYGSHSQCFEAAVADLDLDGDIDFVTATGTTNSNFYMKVFLNKTIQLGIEDTSSCRVVESPILRIAENPVSGYAEVIINLPISSHCSVSIFDILGREVETIQEDNLGTGEHVLFWDSGELPIGCYTLMLTTEFDRICSRFVKVK